MDYRFERELPEHEALLERHKKRLASLIIMDDYDAAEEDRLLALIDLTKKHIAIMKIYAGR